VTATGPSPIGVVGHFNLLEQLEPAGPGDLFRARDTRAGRTVAIRLLPASFAASRPERDELLTRATSLGVLSHPNIVTLFASGEHDGRLYFAFEFSKGQPLRAEMAGRPLNVRRAIELAVQIADAVAGAHALGFVHGGLSPESISVTPKGHAKIPAFDLAAQSGYQREGGEFRLHDYDSPEEARGETPDDRSDIYSVGAILFEMLTGRRPNPRGAAAPSASNPHVSKSIDALVLRAIAPSPASRPESASSMAAELRALLAELDSVGGATDEREEPGMSSGPARLVIPLVVIAVVAVIAWLALRP
jgi:serine/threonine protein kinase